MLAPEREGQTARPAQASRLEVLHFIYDDPSNPWVGGGGSVRAREIYRRLLDRLDVRIVTGNYPGAADGKSNGIPYLRLGAATPYWWSRLTYARAANAMLRRAKYDAAVFDFSGYTPLFLPKDRPTGIVLHHLTSPTAHMRWGGILSRGLAGLERVMLRRASRVSATSDSSRDASREIAPDIPVEMVSAGVPAELFGIVRRPKSFLLYFGRLDIFHKGLDTLLEAIAILARERPDIELRIAGRGSSSGKLQAMIDQLGISRNVQLLGAVTDAERNELLATAAIQLMPSRFEGFGLAAAEAMAAGVPLIASSVGSLPEVVDAPRGGILIPPSDPAALAAATERLLDDAGARASLSQSARESARRFSWDAVADAHYQFIRHIAAHGGPRDS